MPRPELLIDLMRHGEPVGGVRYRGHRDDPLSDAGWSQMRAAVDPADPWDGIVSSPLRRCREFAETLSEQLDLALQIDAQFKEMAFGDWEGLLPDEVRTRFPDALRQYWRDPLRHTPPNAEPLAAFQRRIETAGDGLIQQQQQADTGHLLLVVHGGVIRVILCRVLGIPVERFMRIETPFAARSRIRIRFNDAAEAWSSLVHHAFMPPAP
ncbi:MAG: alpha-ribazole phosphatase family protein [Pseudomonadota bacterium]|nr:alpha-ribazole phosphatase family protein [Pseudomonadota bacterium]